ncbi:MAG: exodeoxyribonuclease III, partial [Flavobacteriaceae bacterium]
MKILSYNVNGIRAALNKGFATWLKATQADVICLQETKALEEQVDTQFLSELGYHHYWFSAQKKGYSGVAIFTKHKPQHIAYGSGIDHMDYEGRILRVDFEAFSVMSLYLPSGTNPDRLSYKFKFMDEFREYVDQLKQEHP